MLQTKFHAPEPSGSEKDRFFKYFPVYFYGSNPRHPGAGPVCFKLGKLPQGNATYETSSS